MQKKRKRRSVKLLTALFCLLAAFFILDLRLQQLTLELAEPQINRIALKAASEAVTKALDETADSFVSPGDLGEVSILQTDMDAVNRFMAAVSDHLTKSMEELEDYPVSVPLGSLTKSVLFSGRGPKLSCKLVPYGQIGLYTASHFESCGINQTRHRILLNVQLELSALTAFRSAAVTFENDYILSETILTGEVPESYTYLLMEERELLSKSAQ